MADYSGYWTCNECGANGNNYGAWPHEPTCSAPGKIAEMARERIDKAEREASTREARLESWRSLDDETLLLELRLIRQLSDAKHREYLMLHDRLVCELQVVNERGIIDKWLKR